MMLTQRSILRIFVVSIFLMSNSASSFFGYSRQQENWDNAIEACGISCAGIAGVYSLYKLIDLFFARTNEELIATGNALCTQVNQKYKAIIDCQVRLETECLQNEETLKYIAGTLKNESIDSYISALNISISNMQREKQAITNRVFKLKNDKNYCEQYCAVVEQLNNTADELSQLITCLDKVNNYLANHKKYIMLWQLTQNISIRYINKFVSMPERQDDVEEYLFSLVMGHAFSNVEYPYITYGKQIDDDCIKLHSSLAAEYYDLNNQAIELLSILERIKAYVFASERYAHELNLVEAKRIAALEAAFESE